MKVVGISHDELVPSSNGLFRTKVSWQKPLFNHSEVNHYNYKITNGSEKTAGNIRRRAIDFNIVFTTVSEMICVAVRLETFLKIVNKITPDGITVSVLDEKNSSTWIAYETISPLYLLKC